MKQSRRVSPRVPYDEAVCLTRVDGQGRLFGRSIDLGPAGIYLTCAELCEIGTELICAVLLPGGPRRLRGRVVRLVALPRAVGIAVAFTELKEADRLVLERLVASRVAAAVPAKLHVDGLDHDLRCEAVLGDRTMRVSTALPAFLRLDARVDVGVDVSPRLGLDPPEPQKARGVISRIAVDPLSPDGVPRLSLDVDIGTAPHGTLARTQVPVEDLAPPSGLPRPYGHPLPSVMVSHGLERELAHAADEALDEALDEASAEAADEASAEASDEASQPAPPRGRRKGGTAELPNRLDDPLVAPPGREATLRMFTLAARGARAQSTAWLALPLFMIAVELLMLAHLAR